MTALVGRSIYAGEGAGTALVSTAPISFFGGVDLETGVIVEKGHPLEGECLAGRVLVFPRGTGSTVGSFALLRLARDGCGWRRWSWPSSATPPWPWAPSSRRSPVLTR